MTFKIGMKVVCVDDTPDWLGRELVIKKGEVYTIAEMFNWRGKLCVRLVEVKTEQAPGWYASRFRPAVSPKQEVSFTTGAPLDSEQWDNRKRVDEPAWGASA